MFRVNTAGAVGDDTETTGSTENVSASAGRTTDDCRRQMKTFSGAKEEQMSRQKLYLDTLRVIRVTLALTARTESARDDRFPAYPAECQSQSLRTLCYLNVAAANCT